MASVAPHVGFLVARLEPTQTFVLRDLRALGAHCETSLHCLVRPLEPAHTATILPEHPAPLVAPPPYKSELWRRNARVLRLAPRAYWASLADIILLYRRRPRELAENLALFPLAMAAADVMRDSGVELVHACWANHAATAARACARVLGLRYSLSVHAWDLLEDPAALATKCRDAAVVVACSEAARRRLCRRLPELSPARVELCRHGLDLTEYTIAREPAAGDSLLLCVARIAPKKGLATLVRALHRLAESGRRVRATIAGPTRGRRYARELRRAVAQGRGHDRIVLAGWMSPPELRVAFSRSSVYVQPSEPDPWTGDEDGIPNALLEAMASGVPVVATRAGGIPEVVRHGETGLLTEPGDDTALARAIRQVLDDPDAAERRARAARRLIEQEHDAARAGLRLMRALLATVP